MKTYSLHNPLAHAEEIKPLQAALINDKFYYGPVDGVFGRGTADACKRAKFRFGYPMDQVLPTGGQQLLDFLTGHEGLPPDFQRRRKSRGYGVSKADTIRKHIVDHALWGVNNAGQIHYVQLRPMDHLATPRKLPWSCDCSEFVTTIYHWAGAPDPNGMKYNGYGYTGTMLDNGVSIPIFQAKIADVVIWGVSPGHHTAVIVEVNPHNLHDPLLVSMGQENDPRKVTMINETNSQNKPFVVKRYIGG